MHVYKSRTYCRKKLSEENTFRIGLKKPGRSYKYVCFPSWLKGSPHYLFSSIPTEERDQRRREQGAAET